MKGVSIVVIVGVAVACSNGPKAPANNSLPPVTMISPDTSIHIGAQFSPDGSRLYWWQPDGLAYELWTATSTLSGATRVGITVSTPAPMYWSPDGSTAAVPSSGKGIEEIVLLSATGTREFVSGTFMVPIRWHPDGDRLAYLTTIASATGAALQTLVGSVSRGGARPLLPDLTVSAVGAWSPDGSRIAYLTFGDGRSKVWAADSNGRNARALVTDGFESLARGPNWFSPDGREVVYESRRTGTSDIWVAPLDGSPPRQLTRDVRNDYAPTWSPDGQWIAFVSERGRQTDLWIVPAAGGEAIRVTDDAATEELMQWLPGSRLAFLTGESVGSIWSMPVDGVQPTRLTPDSIVVGRFSLSPDGSQFVFLIERGGGKSDLAVMPTGGGPMRILMEGGASASFVWSPDGSKLVLSSDRGGSDDIWLVEVSTGTVHQLTNWLEWELGPFWNADGTAVYFLSNKSATLADLWTVPAAGGEPTRVTRTGTFNSVTARRGDSTLYGSVLTPDGAIHTVRIAADGSVVPLWTVGNSEPWSVTPAADSLLIAQPLPGGGAAYRLIAITGQGDGTEFLGTNDALSAITSDWRYVSYLRREGATGDVMLLDRKTGTTKQLTSTPEDEIGPEVTPDGKTVVYRQRRDIRRVAIADLSKLLTQGSR